MKIILEGELGQKFGEEWELSVFSPSEALRAIAVQSPGFLEYLNSSQERGIEFLIFSDEELIDNPENLNLSCELLVISPILIGEGGNPIIRGLVGATMIATAFLIPGGVTLFGANLSSAIGLLGASMVLGGISQLLSPVPKQQADPKEKSNDIIDRANSVVQQGARVPVGYGELTVSDLIPISQGIVDEKMITVDDDYALYKRVTEIELPYVAKAVDQYSYLSSPTTFRLFTLDYLTNRDQLTGVVVDRSPFNRLAIEITFSTSATGLNIRTAYPLQRIRIHASVAGYDGATNLEIQGESNDVLGSFNLNYFWTDIDLTGLSQFNIPRYKYVFIFTTSRPENFYIAVAEMQLFGAISLDESLSNIKG